MKSGKRKRDEENDDTCSSSSEEESVEVKRRRVGWSKEDELLLKRLKEKGGTWEQISKSFPGRTAIACKQRYNIHLNEGGKQRIPWSKEDDLLLSRLKEKGGTWE
jgi:hypothetical protein